MASRICLWIWKTMSLIPKKKIWSAVLLSIRIENCFEKQLPHMLVTSSSHMMRGECVEWVHSQLHRTVANKDGPWLMWDLKTREKGGKRKGFYFVKAEGFGCICLSFAWYLQSNCAWQSRVDPIPPFSHHLPTPNIIITFSSTLSTLPVWFWLQKLWSEEPTSLHHHRLCKKVLFISIICEIPSFPEELRVNS